MVSLNEEQPDFKQKKKSSDFKSKSIGYLLTTLISAQVGYEGLSLVEMQGPYLDFYHILYQVGTLLPCVFVALNFSHKNETATFFARIYAMLFPLLAIGYILMAYIIVPQHTSVHLLVQWYIYFLGIRQFTLPVIVSIIYLK